MATQKIYKAYGPRPPKPVVETGVGLTKQYHADECNINLIMARFQKTGIIEHRNQYEAQYDDATGIDFQTAMNLVKRAEQMFDDLPSSLRKRFHNDPAQFMDFVNNIDNQDEMIKLGLAVDNRVPEPEPVKVEVINNVPDTTPSQTPSEPV